MTKIDLLDRFLNFLENRVRPFIVDGLQPSIAARETD